MTREKFEALLEEFASAVMAMEMTSDSDESQKACDEAKAAVMRAFDEKDSA